MKAKDRENLFRQWLEEHKGLIFRVVRAYAATREHQEDLFQDILTQLWISIPSYRGESGSARWVYKVALNTAFTWLRAEKKTRRQHRPLWEIAEQASTCDDEDRKQKEVLIEKLYVAIRQLSEVDRSLILLRLDGLSYSNISDILGISENNIGVKLTRIRKKLAELMKGLTDGLG